MNIYTEYELIRETARDNPESVIRLQQTVYGNKLQFASGDFNDNIKQIKKKKRLYRYIIVIYNNNA